MTHLVRSAGLHAVLVGTLLVCGGCGRGGAVRFTPSSATAKTSVQAALEAWQAGRPPGRITSAAPNVEVVDTTRRPGQSLQSFEVLSESSVSGQGRCFVIRLQLENPREALRARYVVVGIDPIWVFRKEDYDKLAHWEHPQEIPLTKEAADDDSASNEPPTTHDRS